MTVRHRYFTADKGSPIHVDLARIFTERRKGSKALRAFMKRYGIASVYGTTPADFRFDFNCTGKDDFNLKWSRVRGSRFIRYRPRRNTAEGKALAVEIGALPPMPAIDEAINVVPGLHSGFPLVFGGGKCYSAFIRYYHHDTGTLVVSVPWQDVDPKELAAYVKQAKSKRRHSWSADMDFAQWTPPDWLREIKEWEALKLIDDEKAVPA